VSRWHQSRDIKNHLKCYVRHVQRSVPSETVTGSNDECAFAVCAVIEFVSILKHAVRRADFVRGHSLQHLRTGYGLQLHRTCSVKEAKVLQHLGWGGVCQTALHWLVVLL